ncbi:MAG: hypothetical protein RLZZ232_1057 [Planctomycetota bacterium]
MSSPVLNVRTEQPRPHERIMHPRRRPRKKGDRYDQKWCRRQSREHGTYPREDQGQSTHDQVHGTPQTMHGLRRPNWGGHSALVSEKFERSPFRLPPATHWAAVASVDF